MSTHIKTIVGRYEIVTRRNNPVSVYDSSELDLTRFWGGTTNGRMLQLTIQGDRTAYIQLTQEQVKELAQTLIDSFDDEIYPSE
jgi:hypothetical protein